MSQRAWIAALGMVIWLGMAAAGVTQQAASPKKDPQLAERDRLYKEALAARDAEKWAEAFRLGRAVVDLEAKLLGSEHQELLSTWDLVGECAERAEDWAAAETARDASLRIAAAVYPAGDYHRTEARLAREHVNRLRGLSAAQRKRLRELEQENGRAVQLYQQGRFADAIALEKTVLADYKRLLGPEHPVAATGLNNLAEFYREQANYAAAEPLFQRALGIYEKTIGPKHPSTANCLNNLARMYHAQGNYAAAEPLYQRALKIWETALGPEHTSTASFLNNLAEFYREQANYAAAEPLYRRALKIYEKTLGPEHSSTAIVLNNLALLYQAQGNHAAAELLYQRALGIYEKTLGPEHPTTAASLNNLAELYRVQADFAAAEPLYLRALKTYEKVLGPEHPNVAGCLNNLALLYQAQANYAAAEPPSQRALKIYEKVFGPEHPLTATSLNNLAQLYQAKGDYPAAEPLYQRALKTYEKVLGPEHPNVANCLNNLAGLYREQGQYAVAEPLLVRALKIYEETLGPINSLTATALNNLAGLYQAQANYAAAEPLYLRALKIDEKALGLAHPSTATCLSNLAGLYQAQANYAAAEPLYQRALEIEEKALGPEHPDTARGLNNLAMVYKSQGKYATAEPLYLRALKIRRKVQGAEHPDTAGSLNNLAELYRAQGNYAAAEPLSHQALEIYEKTLGPVHPLTATGLNNLAGLYRLQRKYATAEPLYQRALEIREKALGPDHPDTATSRHNLALLYWRHLDPTKARPLAEKSLATMRKLLEQTATIQSEQQQLLMARQSDVDLSAWLTIGSRTKSPQDDWTQVIPWKGLVTARQTLLRRDMKDEPLLAKYRLITQQLSRVAITPPPYPSDPEQLPAWEARREQWQAEKKRLEDAHEQLEKELAEKSSAFAQSKARQRVTAEEITNRLAQQPHPTALIDLYPYWYWGQGDEKNEDRLAAYVARGDGRVARVRLGDLETIQTALTNWRTTLGRGAEGQAAGETLRERLWLPLEAELHGIEVVLVSPNGQLAQLPWGALPGAKPGTYLIEERAFAVLPIPHFLPEIAEPKQVLGAPRSLLVVADVDYDGVSTTPTDLLVASTAIGRLNRGGELRKFPRLRAAKDEADAILQGFRKSRPNVQPLLLTGAAATEDAVRHAVEQEEWLHLITHGYFAPESIKSALQVAQQDRERFSRLDRTEPILRGPHPGVLSGLAFAGANRPPEAGKDDGILTALDVSGLDLRKVDTVVLSACETGLGEVAGGEGLLGLQRAFQVAGAKTCVASLWSVDDAGTRVFMQRFYDNLWDKKLPRLDALREAQLWVLRHPKEFLAQFNESERRAIKARGGLEFLSSETENIGDATPPFYWAAFVLSGDWR